MRRFLYGAAHRAQLDVARAPALACGHVQHPTWGKLYLFTAHNPDVPVKCDHCKREIAKGEVFSSLWYRVPVAVDNARCAECRPLKQGRCA